MIKKIIDSISLKDQLDTGKRDITLIGFIKILCRERGKIVPGSLREGKNVCTLAGQEHILRAISYSAYGVTSSEDVGARTDRIRYLGLGTGTQEEVSSVLRLTTPIPWDTSNGTFLSELAIPTYPPYSSSSFVGSAVQYTREFTEAQLSINGSTVYITEAGLFTDGAPTSSPISYTPKTRNLTWSSASSQVPSFYKTFEAVQKTSRFVLEYSWEVRLA